MPVTAPQDVNAHDGGATNLSVDGLQGCATGAAHLPELIEEDGFVTVWPPIAAGALPETRKEYP